MLASGKSCHAAKGRLWCCWMKMHHCVPFLRPWHRSLTYWFGLFGAALILWCWIDSRYHRTHLSSGGKTGFGALNECSEIKIGIWLGSPFPYPRVFFVEKRDAEDFSWKSSFMVEHKEISSTSGDTVYILTLPYYQLLLAWILVAGALMFYRQRRKRRILQQAALADAAIQQIPATTGSTAHSDRSAF